MVAVTDRPDYHTPPGQSIPGIASDPREFQDQVRGFLEQRAAAGNSYVTASQVADEFDVTPQKAGRNLPALAESGDLEVWKSTGQITYRITVDEDGGRDE